MGPLKNPRHERFVVLLLEGKSISEAYAAAGFIGDKGNASRLKARPDVAGRLAELQAEIAAETTVTVQGLLNELEEARKKATDLKQLSAAIKAIDSKAKLSGLLIEKKQIEVGGPGDFANLSSTEEISDRLASMWLEDINWWHGVTKDDHAELVTIFVEAFNRAGALVNAIKARPPVKASINAPSPSQFRS
jgi:hypothetical protein